MTLQTARRQGRELLEKAGVEVPALTADVLLCFAMRCERTYLFAHPEQELREVEWLHYGRYLHERMKGKPTQYVTKRQEFYGREFRVSPDVLIPRPETELLVDTVLKESPGGVIVDVGTGSGAVAVTLALELNRPVVAVDISAPALRMAAGNAERLRAPVSFLQMDLLGGFAAGTVDVVVSNPPYVPAADAPTLSREVHDWEPHLALFAGEDGLDIYRRLVPEAWRVLRVGGFLAMEIGAGEANALREMLSNWKDVRFFEDLAGIPRVVTGRRPKGA